MRHGKKVNHLSRTSAHRKAMLANMACSLIEHKRINTTIAKAKALQKFVEPLITKSKSDTTHSRRMVFKNLRSKQGAAELFRDIAPKIADRPGGYTRIIKLGNRLGDNAEMALIELVDFNELLLGGGTTKKKSRRRGKKKTDTTTTAVETAEIVEEVKTETPKEEVAEEKKPKAEKVEPAVEEKKEVVKEEKTPEAKAEKPAKEEKKEDEGEGKKEE